MRSRRNSLARLSAYFGSSRYGAVVRGTNAYVPPGARKIGSNGSTPAAPSPSLAAGAAAAATAGPSTSPVLPKVKVASPDDKNAKVRLRPKSRTT